MRNGTEIFFFKLQKTKYYNLVIILNNNKRAM